MELQQVNNTPIDTLKVGQVSSNDTSNVNKLSTVDKIAELNSKAVSIDVNENTLKKRSDLSSDMSSYLKDMAKTTSISSSLNQQVQTIDKIQDKVAQLVDGTSTQEEVQPDIAQFISEYNVTTGNVNEKMEKLEDLKGDSTTYFDGMSGAIPLSVDMLNNETATRRTELKSALSKVAEINNAYKDKAQGIITKEVEKLEEASPFKAMDFGKESADFTSANMNIVAGSIASSQANATQTQSVKLLS